MTKKFCLQLFASEVTSIQNLITPEVYTAYMQENSPKLSKLISSGIALTNEKMNALAGGDGLTINIPFLKPLSGGSQVVSEGDKLETRKITGAKQVGVRLIRGNAWSVYDLAQIISGADPVGSILSQLAKYWADEEQSILISILNGIFGAGGALVSTHVNDISAKTGAASNINAETTLDTKQKLGDNAFKITNVAMHSAVYTYLQKQNLIEFIPDSRGEIAFTRYLGYNVLVDDGMPYSSGVYTTVFFGNGAFGYGAGNPNGLIPYEEDRDALGSLSNIISRRALVLHPNGLSWKGTPAKETPTNEELATASNWEKVFEDKNIPMVALKHKINQVDAAGASTMTTRTSK